MEVEDSDPHTSLVIGVAVILDGPPPGQEEFVAVMGARLSQLPRARQLVRTAPLDTGAPTWVDDPRFDLNLHFRRTALPTPGGDGALTALIARVMAARLDRERPLWECWVVEGLAGGRWAMLVKAHHCMVDGVAGAHLLQALCDGDGSGDSGEVSGAVASGAVPDVPEAPLAHRAWAAGSRGLALVLPWRAAKAGVGAAKGVARLVVGLALPAASTSLIGPISRQRRYAVARLSMEDVDRVRTAFGVTVNDVALAAVTGALRGLLLRRGEVPDGRAVRALVPVSVREVRAGVAMDNQVSMLLPYLPVDRATPVDQLRAVHERLAVHKAGKEAQGGRAVTSLLAQVPFLPVAWTVRAAARFPQSSVVTVTTNVPGPRTTRHVLGREVREMWPYVPIALRLRVGVAFLSYRRQLVVGITGDYDTVPDIAVLARGVEDVVGRLVEAGRGG